MIEDLNAPAPGFGYRLLALLLYPLWLAQALLHGRKHGLAQYFPLRLARHGGDSLQRTWLHAASVGEARALAPLVRALLARGDRLLFTSFTASGYQAIRRDFGDSLESAVIPIDSCWHCRRFFDVHRIRLGVIMETELWPELLYQARRRGIELLLVNARLSKKTLDSNRLARGLLKRTLSYFSEILARGERDRDALLRFGACAGRIRVLGNLKTHAPQGSKPPAIVERQYLLLASSHEDEERRLLAARPPALGGMLVVIAPRHPPRSATLQSVLDDLGLRYAVRSLGQRPSDDTEVYLADTLGELPALMAHASVVIMGGSFDDTGGHNLIEPASLGCAIVTGPSDGNIREDIAMLGAGRGVIQVYGIEACWDAVGELLEHPLRAQELGREAQARLARQPDVLQAYLDAINAYL